jgi:(2Fe-2S) ferredoxin
MSADNLSTPAAVDWPPLPVPVQVSRHSPSGDPSGRRRRPRVLVCRGCCCGNPSRRPWVDHDAHLEQIRSACARGNVHVRTVGCLGECQASNLVVVKPGTGQPLWIGQINDDNSLGMLCEWLASGAPVTPTSTAAFAGHILKWHPAAN